MWWNCKGVKWISPYCELMALWNHPMTTFWPCEPFLFNLRNNASGISLNLQKFSINSQLIPWFNFRLRPLATRDKFTRESEILYHQEGEREVCKLLCRNWDTNEGKLKCLSTNWITFQYSNGHHLGRDTFQCSLVRPDGMSWGQGWHRIHSQLKISNSFKAIFKTN